MLRSASSNMTFIERQSSLIKPASRRGSTTSSMHQAPEQSQQQSRRLLFQTQLNHSNVFKELQQNPQLRDNQRSLEVHLDDITCRCNMGDFYTIKEVYQRNIYCNITGVLYQIKDSDIANNFIVSKPLMPSDSRQSFPIDTNDDKESSSEKPVVYLLKFTVFTPPQDVQSFYQRALSQDQQVTHCSVSDSYIVYTVVTKDDGPAEFSVVDETQDAQNTLVVVVDIKSKQEVVLRNPSNSHITAAYIDEGILMLGSQNVAYSLTPKTLFRTSDSQNLAQTNQFRDIQLPEENRANSKIYAFWHTKGQEKVDIFVQSTTEPMISIFQYYTPDGIERIKMSRMRTDMKRSLVHGNTPQQEGEILEVKLTKTLNLDTDYNKNMRMSQVGSSIQNNYNKSSLQNRNLQDSENESQNDSQDLSEADDEHERNSLDHLSSSDDEGYQSGGHEDNHDEINRNLQQNDECETPTPTAVKKKKKLLNQNSVQLNTDLSHKFRSNELQEPLISSNIKPQTDRLLDSQNKVDQSIISPAKQISYHEDFKITKIKFNRRNTIVFRSDGQIDFIGSNYVVYSSRNIDFKKMKWEPAVTAQDLQHRLRHSPTIVDVILDDHDLLLIARDQQVYLFSLDKMTVAKTSIKAEQARLLTQSNRLRPFTDFLVYDNTVVVCHLNMISVCDLNARVCKRKTWRHLSPPMTDLMAEDRDTYNNEESRRDPFRVCNLNIRNIKLRELKGSVMPRIMVLFNNNVIRMLAQDSNMTWVYDEFSTKLLHGEISEVISSKKANSLVLLRHKDSADAAKSDLSVFYFKDSMDDLSRWRVLENIEDHQRIIQVSLQNRFMQDFNKQQSRPKIAIYDDNKSELVIHQLDTIEDINQQSVFNKNTSSANQSYGQFKPIHKIEGFRMMPTDIVIESGEDSFFYLARQNQICKFYINDEAVRKAQREKYHIQESQETKIPDLSDVHKNLEIIARIDSRYQKYSANIEDFRIMNDNGTTYIYASTRSHIYFNQIAQFGKLFSGSKIMRPQLARSCYKMHMDENYGQIAFYQGPFSISVMPLLSSNRISLRGIHHEVEPIFYQTRGHSNLHVLTKNAEIKTWDTTTGKLKSCTLLDRQQFSGYKRMNFFRNRTILCRQNQETLMYEYICVEIVSSKTMQIYAYVVNSEHINFFVNSLNNMLFTEQRGQKHNIFEVRKFDRNSGRIGNVTHIFNRNMPMNFLSPSFSHYIDIESHTHTIKVLDINEKQLCVLPQHLYKNLCSKKDQFSTETFLNKVIFVEDDFILMELDQSNDIIFQVSTQRTVSSFNVLSPNLKFNEKYLPAQFDCQVGEDPQSLMLKQEAQKILFHRASTNIMSPKEHQKEQLKAKMEKLEFQDQSKVKALLKDEQKKSSAFQFLMIEDLIYLNMKRQRHLHFMDMQAVNMVIRDKVVDAGGVHDVKQMKLISVRPFSYAIWKLIEDMSNEKTITSYDLNKQQLATACFSILPDSMGDRARYTKMKTKDPVLKAKLTKALEESQSTPTLLHKLTLRNPDEIKPLLERMNTTWPSLVIPQIYNQEGETPLKTAQKNKHRRVVGWLLDSLKKYPFGYCQYQVSNMIFDIIGEGFEKKVGEYLDQRFMQQPWTLRYPVGSLKQLESGMNQTTATNWPSQTENLEKKFFSKKCAKVPVQMHVLDCPNLHTFSKEDTQKFLLSLSNCDIMIFSHKSIQALIEYSWESTSGVIFKWLFLPFIVYLIDYMVFLNFLFTTELDGDDEIQQHQKFRMLITQLSLLVLAIYFMQLHVRQMMAHKLQLSAAFLWSSADLVPLMANLVSIGISASSNFQDNANLELMKLIYAIATLFLFLKFFYYLRYYREIGHLVRLIFNVMYLMRYFFVVFSCFIITFASAFYAFTGGESGFIEQAHFVFNITIRKSDTSWFDDGYYSAGLWATFIATSMFFTYIMLNITVSMVKGFYDANMRIKTESQYQVMTQLTLDCFPYISAPKEEQALKAPAGTADFIEEASLLESDQSQFQFKLRPNSFCNQYLVIAETEQEDKSGLLSTDPDQSIKDLQKQVNQGFVGVQKQLQHQDELLTSQDKFDSSHAASGGRFEQAVKQAVDERMLQVTEAHSKEIAELKEGQKEILRLLQAKLGDQ